MPVEVLNRDRSPIGGDDHVLNLKSQNNTLVAEACGSRVRSIFGAMDMWGLKFGQRDDEVAVSRAALSGADMGAEPRVWCALFMSDRLVRALRAAKVDAPFKLSRCRIVDGEAK